MLKALDRLPACAGKIICLEAWLRQLARNLCVDLRRECRRRTQSVESLENDPLAQAESDPPGLHVETESEIQQWIAALPSPLRESFVLHIVQEIPVKEIALRLKLSAANVRKRVQLARERLRRDLGGRHHGDGDLKLLSPQSPPPVPVSPGPLTESWELFASTARLRTVRVKLYCDVEQLFHIFPARAPFALDRKLRKLQREVRQHPDNWKMRLEMADLFYLAGDWHKAMIEWRQMPAPFASLSAVLKLGDTLLKLGGIESAAEVFRNARQPDFQSAATGRHLSGWLAFCHHDSARAVLEFQAAAEAEPENPVHRHCLALARRQMDNLPAALAAIQGALELNPDDRVALSLGHEMLLAAGDVPEALRRALHLLKLAPQDLLTLVRLVECRCHLGLTQGAAGRETIQLLRRAQRLAPNSFLLHESLASFFRAQGNPGKALALCCEFAKAHPHCLRNHHGHSDLLRLSGGSDSPPVESDVWKLPATKKCNGRCFGHENSGVCRS